MIAVNGGVKGSLVRETGMHVADRVHRIVIVGGGAAGWLAAATLARLLKTSFCDIRLIDTPPDEAASFSEVALPSFHRLNNLLGIDENDLLQKTRGTFKLGTQFVNWGHLGERYFHAFGSVGAKLDAVSFHHYWIKLHLLGDATSFDSYSTAAVAANHGRFAHPVQDRRSILSLYSYGYHFHAASLAAYLREYAEAHGVTRIDRDVADVQLRGEDGFVDALELEDGSRVRADLYVDCSGAMGRLSRQALGGGYEDWSDWLPCDRIVGIPCTSDGALAPYSESIAEPSGWRRRIPLQHCVDSSFVYCSRHLSDDEAAAALLADLPASALASPRLQRLSPGRPSQFWKKNCIWLTGSGLEPLESTGLHLVQTGITRLVTLFPVSRFSPSDIEEYNRLTTIEHERIRDFLILHYQSAQRGESPFWEHCRQMAIPDTLRVKIDLFRRCGRIAMLEDEHFGEDSWLSLLLGQNINPLGYDPLADVVEIDEVKAALLRMRSMIQEGVAGLPTHRQYIQEHCPAKLGGGP
jgi:tryptophan halogenase